MGSSNRYRINIDNPESNTHMGIPMLTRAGYTYGSAGYPLVAAVLVRADIEGHTVWRVVLTSHTVESARDLMATMWVAGRRVTVVTMDPAAQPRSARGTQAPMDAAANERRADLAKARRLADAGRVKEARELLAKYDLSYIAVEIVVGTDGVGKVRQ